MTLRRIILGFIEASDRESEIGVPIDTIANHVSNTSQVPRKDVMEEIEKLISADEVVLNKIKVDVPEEIKESFPEIRFSSHMRLLKKQEK